MARIVEEQAYNGVIEKIERLGIGDLIGEVRNLVERVQLLVLERRDSNGGAAVRKLIDGSFAEVGSWTKKQTGDIDWTKCNAVNGTRLCVGVEIQFSARSDLVIIDIIHLRRAIRKGAIDIGILVVPSDRLAEFLTDRAPSMAAARRHISEARADDLPILLWALEHDGPGPALAKQRKRTTDR